VGAALGSVASLDGSMTGVAERSVSGSGAEAMGAVLLGVPAPLECSPNHHTEPAVTAITANAPPAKSTGVPRREGATNAMFATVDPSSRC
jgi:hypothetical protein